MASLWCYCNSLLLGFLDPTSGIRAFRVSTGSFVWVEANHFRDCLQFRLDIKVSSFLFRFIFINHCPHCFKLSTKEMAGDSQSSVIFVSHLLTKIDVVKFDGTNNFEMWRCEVMDALTTSNLEDTMIERKTERDF